MIKIISTLIVLLFTVSCYCQNITLIQNTHPKAKELKHHLNATKDTLILNSDTKIHKVEIFNENYDDLHLIEANNTQICLKNIPKGIFVVEVKLTTKIILIDLIVYESYSEDSNSSTTMYSHQAIEGKGMMLDEELKVITRSPHKSIEFLLTGTTSNSKRSKHQKFFWIELQVVNESGSNKTMRLADEKSVEKMIRKHQLELNSDTGKLNTLTVWEVYNTKAFMEKQASDPNFVYTSSTDTFNSTPYYSTTHRFQNL